MSQAGRTKEREPDRQDAEALLCAEVLAEARREAEELLVRARAQAGEVVAAAEQQAATIRKDAMESATAEASLRSGFILAAVPLEQARMRAARVEALLDQLRSEARSRLLSRQGIDTRETLVRLSAEALARMDGREFVLTFCPQDHRMIAPVVAGELRDRLQRSDLRLQLEADPGWSECGVIVRDREGRRVWDNRVTARLERLWPAMRRELARWCGLALGDDDAGGPR